ncbi:hypothetical protein LA76x_2693 [Lysobacter antibioticus]|uniref:Uncharacterized protein n=1 Tax=Lysobacter antibioticus TaxID=84531 RepID=A0A0S2FB84_LYSAN|nr:hypothetical protein LA76x_2693 [Lysobacter antibioticus]
MKGKASGAVFAGPEGGRMSCLGYRSDRSRMIRIGAALST